VAYPLPLELGKRCSSDKHGDTIHSNQTSHSFDAIRGLQLLQGSLIGSNGYFLSQITDEGSMAWRSITYSNWGMCRPRICGPYTSVLTSVRQRLYAG
jgi:hypothetical protein